MVKNVLNQFLLLDGIKAQNRQIMQIALFWAYFAATERETRQPDWAGFFIIGHIIIRSKTDIFLQNFEQFENWT